MVLDACVALLMLSEVPRCREDFTAALAAVRFSARVCRLLASLQGAGFDEGGAALSTLMLPQNARMCFELVRVCIRPFAAVATEPLAL